MLWHLVVSSILLVIGIWALVSYLRSPKQVPDYYPQEKPDEQLPPVASCSLDKQDAEPQEDEHEK